MFCRAVKMTGTLHGDLLLWLSGVGRVGQVDGSLVANVLAVGYPILLAVRIGTGLRLICLPDLYMFVEASTFLSCLVFEPW
jgi:hypothetical protein